MKQRTPKPRRFGPAHPGTAGLRSAEVGTSHRGRPWRLADRDENPLEASGIGYEGDDANLGIEREFPVFSGQALAEITGSCGSRGPKLFLAEP
jgi:hypothetical protein